MKIDIQNILNDEQFIHHECVIASEQCYLIFPKHMGVEWTQSNKIFRSSIWNSEGELISGGFPKFCNWLERPDVFPIPTTIDPQNDYAVEKCDGSCIILSQYKGHIIIRTRGTVDAINEQPNGHELDWLYNQALNINFDCSFIFEWCTPTNKIVINYGDKPQLYLIGTINHDDYSLYTQKQLDIIAFTHSWQRPQYYDFSDGLTSLIKMIRETKSKEGIVLYTNHGQMLHKIKSDWYLHLHKLKSEVSSITKLVEIWFSQNKPPYENFYEYIKTTLDYEIAEFCKDNIEQIVKAYEGYINILHIISTVVHTFQQQYNNNKKEVAIAITNLYEGLNSGIAFSIANNKPIKDETIKKIMLEFIK